MNNKKYLFILLDDEFKDPVVYNDSLITALAITNVHALDIMERNFPEAITGTNLLERIVRFDLILPKVDIIANDEDFGSWAIAGEPQVSVSTERVPPISSFLDDPDK